MMKGRRKSRKHGGKSLSASTSARPMDSQDIDTPDAETEDSGGENSAGDMDVHSPDSNSQGSDSLHDDLSTNEGGSGGGGGSDRPPDANSAIDVQCGENQARLYLDRVGRGGRGSCVLFQGQWLSPNEFQDVSGRQTAKDWKRSIKHHGQSLRCLFTSGALTCKPPRCQCETCDPQGEGKYGADQLQEDKEMSFKTPGDDSSQEDASSDEGGEDQTEKDADGEVSSPPLTSPFSTLEENPAEKGGDDQVSHNPDVERSPRKSKRLSNILPDNIPSLERKKPRKQKKLKKLKEYEDSVDNAEGSLSETNDTVDNSALKTTSDDASPGVLRQADEDQQECKEADFVSQISTTETDVGSQEVTKDSLPVTGIPVDSLPEQLDVVPDDVDEDRELVHTDQEVVDSHEDEMGMETGHNVVSEGNQEVNVNTIDGSHGNITNVLNSEENHQCIEENSGKEETTEQQGDEKMSNHQDARPSEDTNGTDVDMRADFKQDDTELESTSDKAVVDSPVSPSIQTVSDELKSESAVHIGNDESSTRTNDTASDPSQGYGSVLNLVKPESESKPSDVLDAESKPHHDIGPSQQELGTSTCKKESFFNKSGSRLSSIIANLREKATPEICPETPKRGASEPNCDGSEQRKRRRKGVPVMHHVMSMDGSDRSSPLSTMSESSEEASLTSSRTGLIHREDPDSERYFTEEREYIGKHGAKLELPKEYSGTAVSKPHTVVSPAPPPTVTHPSDTRAHASSTKATKSSALSFEETLSKLPQFQLPGMQSGAEKKEHSGSTTAKSESAGKTSGMPDIPSGIPGMPAGFPLLPMHPAFPMFSASDLLSMQSVLAAQYGLGGAWNPAASPFSLPSDFMGPQPPPATKHNPFDYQNLLKDSSARSSTSAPERLARSSAAVSSAASSSRSSSATLHYGGDRYKDRLQQQHRKSRSSSSSIKPANHHMDALQSLYKASTSSVGIPSKSASASSLPTKPESKKKKVPTATLR